jgi:hypothetical protein
MHGATIKVKKKKGCCHVQIGASVIASNTVIKQQGTQNSICERFVPDGKEQITVWGVGWRGITKRWLQQNFSAVGTATDNQSQGVRMCGTLSPCPYVLS